MEDIGRDEHTTRRGRPASSRGIVATEGLPSFSTALRRIRGQAELWRCPVCDSSLVQPMSATAPSTGTVHVARRCPECGRRDTVTAGLGEVHEYDRRLVEGRDALKDEYRRFAMRTMREDAERIIAALRSGALQPSDF